MKQDPLQEYIARLGDRREARLIEGFKADRRVVQLEPVAPPYTTDKLEAAADATREALAGAPDIVCQAAFFDGEFFGYADFVEGTDGGWHVCDAKLARSAKPKALIQLGAYADQVRRLGLPLAADMSLLLGDA